MSSKTLYEIWKWSTWMGSLGLIAMFQQLIPREYVQSIRLSIRLWLLRVLNSDIFYDIHEYETSDTNKLYLDVEIYLGSISLEDVHRLKMSKSKNAKAPLVCMSNDQRMFDTFQGATFQWVHSTYDRQKSMSFNFYESRSDVKRKFTLQVKKKDRGKVLDAYIAHIEARGLELRRKARELRLYTNNKGEDYMSRMRGNPWDSVSFLHPATFETLALDGDLKTKIETDLENFAANENYYRRVGKAWKRGYLLYGPPGTGKSSMIAAIANKMRYDVYDLELTEVGSNAELRKLLLKTSNKSVIVIEDIDCSLDLWGQRKKKKKPETTPKDESAARKPPEPEKEQSKVTLSGLLNFVDGLWSCCGTERIFIFTTNYMDQLDPALLRAGRMDMHIHLSYCTFSAFKILSRNYLELAEHELFDKVESAFEGSFMTPADVAELLIKNQDLDPEIVLESLIVALGEHREDPRVKAKAEEEKQRLEEEEEERKDKEDRERKEEEKKKKKKEQKEKNEAEKKGNDVSDGQEKKESKAVPSENGKM